MINWIWINKYKAGIGNWIFVTILLTGLGLVTGFKIIIYIIVLGLLALLGGIVYGLICIFISKHVSKKANQQERKNNE